MKSKEDISRDLNEIADNRGLTGASVQLAIDFLTYAIYLDEVSKAALLHEDSLGRVSTENGMINQCIDLGYSVYRGSNPTVELDCDVTALLNKSRFDILYSSSRFKIFASEQLSMVPGQVNQSITGIISRERVVNEIIVNSQNTYYVDILESNLIETCQIKLNGNVVSITRSYADHVKSGDMFVMTLPDYGVRIFNLSGFSINDAVEFTGFTRLELDEVPESELNKVNLAEANVNSRSFSEGLSRDDVRGSLTRASYSTRVDAIIKSNEDISYIFREEYVSRLLDTNTIFRSNSTQIDIYYVLKPNASNITPTEIDDFKTKYLSYYVSNDINILQSDEILVEVNLNVVLNQPVTSFSEIEDIFHLREYQIERELVVQKIRSEISKLSNVVYVDSIELGVLDNGVLVNYVPQEDSHIKFNFNITQIL